MIGLKAIGAYLKRERLLRQIPLERITKTTRIPLHVLQAIEEGDLRKLPAEAFVRGFIRSVARELGLDADETMLRLQEYQIEERSSVAQAQGAGPEGGREMRAAWRRPLWVLAALGAGVVLAVLLPRLLSGPG